MKSVQGDSGHAQVKMVAGVYSHIIDDDRRLNAQKFEEQLYQPKPTAAVVEETKESVPQASASDQETLLIINKSEVKNYVYTLSVVGL